VLAWSGASDTMMVLLELLTKIIDVHHSICAGALSPVARLAILGILCFRRGRREALNGGVDLGERF
jgi:hypothetical protein